jgi:hypothetical protein
VSRIKRKKKQWLFGSFSRKKAKKKKPSFFAIAAGSIL